MNNNLKDVLSKLYPEKKGKRFYFKSECFIRWQSLSNRDEYCQFQLVDISAKGLSFTLNPHYNLEKYFQSGDTYISAENKNIAVLLTNGENSLVIKSLKVRWSRKGVAGCTIVLSAQNKERLKALIQNSEIRDTLLETTTVYGQKISKRLIITLLEKSKFIDNV